MSWAVLLKPVAALLSRLAQMAGLILAGRRMGRMKADLKAAEARDEARRKMAETPRPDADTAVERLRDGEF